MSNISPQGIGKGNLPLGRTIYLSPFGNDQTGRVGDINRPFQTIDRAGELVREFISKGITTYQIVCVTGDYDFDATFITDNAQRLTQGLRNYIDLGDAVINVSSSSSQQPIFTDADESGIFTTINAPAIRVTLKAGNTVINFDDDFYVATRWANIDSEVEQEFGTVNFAGSRPLGFYNSCKYVRFKCKRAILDNTSTVWNSGPPYGPSGDLTGQHTRDIQGHFEYVEGNGTRDGYLVRYQLNESAAYIDFETKINVRVDKVRKQAIGSFLMAGPGERRDCLLEYSFGDIFSSQNANDPEFSITTANGGVTGDFVNSRLTLTAENVDTGGVGVWFGNPGTAGDGFDMDASQIRIDIANFVCRYNGGNNRFFLFNETDLTNGAIINIRIGYLECNSGSGGGMIDLTGLTISSDSLIVFEDCYFKCNTARPVVLLKNTADMDRVVFKNCVFDTAGGTTVALSGGGAANFVVAGAYDANAVSVGAGVTVVKYPEYV